MFSWVKLSEVAKWTGAQTAQWKDCAIQRVSTDTRTLEKGDLFWAIKGERFDGHDYLKQAVEKGACAVVSEAASSLSVPVLVVEDSLRAMACVASHLRDAFQGNVVAITGSAGKSSTKEMTSVLLGPKCLASPASFNNLIGVSKTLFLLEDQTQYLVLEMGMNAPGEIRELCEYFKPNVGLITNIGDAHMGKLGGKEAVFRAKKELFETGLEKQGSFAGVLNLDDPLVVRAYREVFSVAPRVSYTLSENEADVKLISRAIDPMTGWLKVAFSFGGKRLEQDLPLFGLHQAQNLVAACAIALFLGIPFEEIRRRLVQIRPASHRGEIFSLSDERLLIDESYNSNPAALRSSIESLLQMDPTRRHFLILGDMRELGEFSEKEHHQMGAWIAREYLKRRIAYSVLAVGSEVGALVKGIQGVDSKASVKWVADVTEAQATLPAHLNARDIVYIKSSRGGNLDRLVNLLCKEGVSNS